MLAWSVGLSLLWDVRIEVALPFIGLAALTGLRFFAKRDTTADQVLFYLYNVRADCLPLVDHPHL
jgi:hypothetical protein